jgi:hypothetical protein
MRRQVCFDGSENLMPAVEMALNHPDVGVVVVRDLITPDFIKKVSADLTNEEHAKILYDDIPELTEVDRYVEDWWEKYGYADYKLDTDGHLTHAMIQKEPKKKHVDGDYVAPIFGPLALSVGLTGVSRTFGQKRRHRTMHADRTFNPETFKRYNDAITASETRLPRSYVIQYDRDGVIIPTHPHSSAHAVKFITPKRTASIYDYRIDKKPA